MEKLTRILAVANGIDECALVLGKSVGLARRFGAHIELLWFGTADAREIAKLLSELAYDEVSLTRVDCGGESLTATILRRVVATRPDLVVKAPAGAHPLKRWTLGENDWRLANDCPVPVLLVRPKPWASPIRFAAAVDVADDETFDTARSILHAAGFMALGCHGDLDILYSECEQHDDALRMERAVKLAQLVREYHVGCERIQVFEGAPEKTLPPLVSARHYDVLVLGAQSRQPALKILFGATNSRLVQATEGDVVLVKAPGREAGIGHQNESPREKRFHESEQFA
jgi:nucleotide-binding universal stress UspA family protein